MKLSQVKKLVNQMDSGSDPEVKIRYTDSVRGLLVTDLVSIREEISRTEASASESVFILDATA